MYKYIWSDLNKVGVDGTETRKARKEVLLIIGELIYALFFLTSFKCCVRVCEGPSKVLR